MGFEHVFIRLNISYMLPLHHGRPIITLIINLHVQIIRADFKHVYSWVPPLVTWPEVPPVPSLTAERILLALFMRSAFRTGYMVQGTYLPVSGSEC